MAEFVPKQPDWLRLFAYQALRAPLVDEWFDALELRPGSRLVDVGCGPGYVSLRGAQRVGATGRVYAVDRHDEALAVLREIASLHGLRQIEPIAAAADDLETLPAPVDAVLLAMVLHHDKDPAALLRRAATWSERDKPVLVAEFDPSGPCMIGPPARRRLGARVLKRYAADAGLLLHKESRQSDEHYFAVLTK